jgi:uncharacterized protein YndB with AHSA1/START domain
MFTVTKDLNKHELTVERIVRGSRELAWEGWTKSEHIACWWGPNYWTTTVYKMDVSLGGVWHYCMQANNGEGDEVWGRAVYCEIVKPSRLVYIETLSNGEGEAVDASQRTVIVEFLKLEADLTKLVIRTQYTTIAELETAENMGMVEGFSEAFDRLEALLLSAMSA